MRDERAATEGAGLVVLGMSFDSVEANRKFAEKQSFPFLLLSDEDKSVGKAYGAKGLMPFPRRISYVIDEEGKILLAYPDVNPKTHLEFILRDLKTAS